MDHEVNSDGFRMLLKIDRADEVQIKCFIFVNLKKMKFIKDVEQHIESILDVKDVSLFIEDVWLPSNETVYLIKENDTVTVKIKADVMVVTDSKNNNEEEVILARKKRKRVESQQINVTLDVLYKELYDKRKELFTTGKKTAPKAITNEPVDDVPNIPNIKNKRIRKHKKKSANKEDKQTEKSITTPNTNYLTKEKVFLSGGKHTRFAEDLESNAVNLLEQANEHENTAITSSVEVGSSGKDLNNDVTSKEIRSNAIEQGASNNQRKVDELFSVESNEINEVVQPTMEVIQESGGAPVHIDNMEPSNNDSSTVETTDHLQDDWKTKLLNLATNKEVESKVFHRKDVE